MKKIIYISLFFAFIFAKTTSAQITIAPTMLFIDEENRFGSFLVLNGSDQPQEVSIEFPFGYPVTNENGNIQMIYDDSVTAQEFGISDRVRGFPQNFILEPGQRQVVRLTIRPKNFSDAMYWTRIRTTSNPQSAAIGDTTTGQITAQITYELEQVTTLFYKKGDLNTGIEIQSFIHEETDSTVKFIADVSRTGNSPFIGSIFLKITDDEGTLVTEKMVSTSVYFDFRQIFEVPRTQLSNGSYSAEIIFKSERPDIPKGKLVPMEPISKSISFESE